MPNVLMLVKSRRLLLLGMTLSLVAVPAQAQGLFDFFRRLSQPSAPAPTYHPFDNGIPQSSQPRRKPTRPKPVEPTPIKMPDKPKAPGEIDNPVPLLLADSTLRPGDMVMFPDGLRVFTGKPGTQHRLADFQPLSRAGKSLSRETRKLVAQLNPGVNAAWSTTGLQAQGKLAANTKDVATTGSLRRTRR